MNNKMDMLQHACKQKLQSIELETSSYPLIVDCATYIAQIKISTQILSYKLCFKE